MKKFLQKKLKNQKGLTLVELLAVIVILGIIAAIAVPAIGSIIDNSRVKAVKADAQTILSASNLYFTENSDKESVTLYELEKDGYVKDTGYFTKPTEAAKGPTVTKAPNGNTINGSASYGTGDDKTVTFNEVTSKRITESGNDKTVNPKTT